MRNKYFILNILSSVSQNQLFLMVLDPITNIPSYQSNLPRIPNVIIMDWQWSEILFKPHDLIVAILGRLTFSEKNFIYFDKKQIILREINLNIEFLVNFLISLWHFNKEKNSSMKQNKKLIENLNKLNKK